MPVNKRTEKKIKKDQTRGICVECEQIIQPGHYRLLKYGNRLTPSVICEDCEAKQKK